MSTEVYLYTTPDAYTVETKDVDGEGQMSAKGTALVDFPEHVRRLRNAQANPELDYQVVVVLPEGKISVPSWRLDETTSPMTVYFEGLVEQS